jgi:hypothetical protein
MGRRERRVHILVSSCSGTQLEDGDGGREQKAVEGRGILRCIRQVAPMSPYLLWTNPSAW